MNHLPHLPEHWRIFWQFILFGLIGASGVIVDTAVVVLCREFASLDVRIAAIPAFFVAVSWNYELNRRITFRRETQHAPRTPSYVTFVLICLVGLLIRILSMHIMIEFLGMHDHKSFLLPAFRLSYLASFIGIFIASTFNFLGSKYFAFR